MIFLIIRDSHKTKPSKKINEGLRQLDTRLLNISLCRNTRFQSLIRECGVYVVCNKIQYIYYIQPVKDYVTNIA